MTDSELCSRFEGAKEQAPKLVTAEEIVESHFDLVKYEAAEAVITNLKDKQRRLLKPWVSRSSSTGFPELPQIPGLMNVHSSGRDRDFPVETLQEFLDLIFPPKDFETQGRLWRQYVSATPISRDDVVKLERTVLLRSMILSSTKSLSNLRNRLYLHCLNELIRQEMIVCVERGIILHSIAEEMRMTFDTYAILLRNSTSWGRTRGDDTTLGEVTKADDDLKTITEEKQQMIDKKAQLHDKLHFLKRTHKYQHEADQKEREDNLLMLARCNQQLEILLEHVFPNSKLLKASKMANVAGGISQV